VRKIGDRDLEEVREVKNKESIQIFKSTTNPSSPRAAKRKASVRGTVCYVQQRCLTNYIWLRPYLRELYLRVVWIIGIEFHSNNSNLGIYQLS
jgi:hypothetical protein